MRLRVGRQPASEVLFSPSGKQWTGWVCVVRVEVLKRPDEVGRTESTRRVTAFRSCVSAGG